MKIIVKFHVEKVACFHTFWPRKHFVARDIIHMYLSHHHLIPLSSSLLNIGC